MNVTPTEPRSERIELRTSPAEKALLARAAAIERLDLTSFVLRSVLPRAESIVSASEQVSLSHHDTLRILDLLENPPAPSPRMLSAAREPLKPE